MNIDDLYSDAISLIDLADEREIPLYQVQTVFKDSINQSARNFFGLKTRVTDLVEFHKIDDLTALKGNLNKLVGSHIAFDDKMITLVRNVDISDIGQKLQKAFDDNFEPTEYTYSLHKIEPLSEHQKMFQFGTIREINVRENLSVESLKDNIVEDYQELIGIKKTKLRCYDFVLLDFQRKIMVIGVDLAQILGANEVNIANINFTNFLKKELRIKSFDNQRIDLFPKIKYFYDLPKNTDNGVIEIYFMTDEGTAHHETARGKTKDLRTATYHSSGVQGLKKIKSLNEMLTPDIQAYRITSKFYEIEKELQIALKSSYIAINTNNGSHLYESFIYGVRDLKGFDFVIDQLLK